MEFVAIDEPAPPTYERDTKDRLRLLLRNLGTRDRQVVKLLYGLDKRGPMTAYDAGKLLGVTHQRVSQLHNRAIQQMRDWFGCSDLTATVRKHLAETY